MRGEERVMLREAPSLLPSKNCYCKLLHRRRRKLMMMVMTTMRINLRVMIVSTDMIEKYDHDDDEEGGCHLALCSTG